MSVFVCVFDGVNITQKIIINIFHLLVTLNYQ
jgi:hypothetical protein